MEPEDKALLQKLAALTEENNRILCKMRRAAIWGNVFRVFYWILIIGISIGAYVYIQPYLNQAIKTYNDVTRTVNKLSLPKGF